MLITSPGYMQTRSAEVGLGVLMFVSGWVFIQPGETMTGPAYATLREWMPSWLSEEVGGGILIVAAIARLIALYVNSHHSSTPLIRFGGCMVGASFWVTAAIGFWLGHTDATPWVLGLTSVLGAGEAYSGVRTGVDADALDSLGFRRRAMVARRRAKTDA